MGATAAVALFVRGRAHVAHVGDVRIYRLREADLEPDRREVTTSPGEIFVLCSHAITATLDDAAIASVLRRRSLQRRCHERS